MKRDSDVIGAELHMAAKILAGRIWKIVADWGNWERETFGDELSRSADVFADYVSRATVTGLPKERLDYGRRARSQYFEIRSILRRAFSKDVISEDDIDSLLIIMEKIEPELKALVDRLDRQTRFKR